MKLKANRIIINVIKNNLSFFDSFESVYLFGSLLDERKKPNDIDLLLIYSEYSNDINNELTKISTILEKEFNLYVDFTILSVSEEKQTNFLKRIHPKYLKLK